MSFTLSSVLVVLSVISIFINGFNFGIDYTGGTILDLQFKQPVTVAQVREVIDDSNMNLENSVIQLSGVTDQESSQEVMIRMRNLESDESKAISDQLNEKLGGAEVKRIESVGAVIGSEVTKNAVSGSEAYRIGRRRHRLGSHEKCRDQPGRGLYRPGGIYFLPL